MDYEIVKYDTSFKDQTLALQNHLWGGLAQRNKAYFEWKFEHNPYLPGTNIYLVTHQAKVVGMRGMFGGKWVLGPNNPEQVIPLSSDTVIAPEHRKYGLLEKLTAFAAKDLAAQGYPLVGIASAGRATHGQAVMSGWSCIGGYEKYTRAPPLMEKSKAARRYFLKRPKVGAFVKKYLVAPLHRATGGQSKKPDRLYRLFTPGGSTTFMDDGAKIHVEEHPRPAQMSQLADRCADATRIRHVRDAPYFTWRYTNPRRTYCFLFVESEQLDGYMVLQAGTTPLQTDVAIVDIMAANLDVWRKLVRSALKIRGSLEYTIWTVSLSEGQKTFLREAGFVAEDQPANLTRTGPGFLLKAVAEQESGGTQIEIDHDIYDIGNWDLHMIDSDNL